MFLTVAHRPFELWYKRIHVLRNSNIILCTKTNSENWTKILRANFSSFVYPRAKMIVKFDTDDF